MPESAELTELTELMEPTDPTEPKGLESLSLSPSLSLDRMSALLDVGMAFIL